ncbi:hypothetical protein GCWU000246_00745 [Jonquetella anthropi E3_33 E1]|nr:hypothetical protein GCWU000246_00745 [Jonquetella anthropi E3_33 E1]
MADACPCFEDISASVAKRAEDSFSIGRRQHNERPLGAIEELRRGKKPGRPFCSTAELMTDLNADEQAQCLGRNKCTAKQRGSMGGLNGRLRGSRWTQRPSTERFFPDFHKRYILSCRLLLVFTSAMRSELHGIEIVEHPAICRADNKMCQLKASRGVVTSALSLRRPKEQHYFPLVLARANWRRVTT